MEERREAIRIMIKFYGENGRSLLEEWTKMLGRTRKADGNLIFSGMGTSFISPLIIRPLLASKGITSFMFEAGEFLHYGLGTVRSKDLIVLISQSGESIETCRIAEEMKGLCPIIAIVNDEESTLAGYGDLVLPMTAGEEASITTKTYTNTLGLLNIMGVTAVSGNLEKEMESLIESSFHMDDFLENRSDEIKAAEEHLKNASALHFLTRGPALAGAFQGALTFMEGAHLTAVAMPCGSFRHGPIELIGKGHRAIVYVPSSETRGLVVRMISEMAERGSHIVAFSSGSMEIDDPNIVEISFPEVDDRHLPISAATAQELLLDRIASRRGLKCGVFKHTSKVTKIE